MAIYSPFTRGLAVAGWIFCAFFSINLLLTGTGAAVWHFLPWLLLVAWGLFALLWRPHLRVDAAGLTVCNIVRDHVLPFGTLRAVRVSHSVSFDTASGRIPSWGAPGAGRPSRRAPDDAGSPPTALLVNRAWDAWEEARPPGETSTPDRVRSRWNGPVLGVGLLVLALCLASALS